MWAAIGGAVASQLGNITGAILNKKAADNANQTNRDINSANVDHQREFAQHGVRWKVADAKAAGVHPLVALGAPTASFSPSSIGATPDTSMGDMARNMGQDVSRAISATRTAEERQMATLQLQSAQLDLQGKALDNQIKNSQLQKLNSTGPAFPGGGSFIEGQGHGSGRVKTNAMERTASLPGSPESEPGAINSVGWMKTKTGLVPVPSSDVKQRIEDNMPHEWSHYFRNNIAPNWGGGSKPPKSALPKGAKDWEWSFTSQEFQPVYQKSKSPYQKAQDFYDKNLRYPK